MGTNCKEVHKEIFCPMPCNTDIDGSKSNAINLFLHDFLAKQHSGKAIKLNTNEKLMEESDNVNNYE